MWRIMEAPPFGPYLDRSCCMCFFHMLTFTVRCVSCIFNYFHVLIRCRMFEMLLHCFFHEKGRCFLVVSSFSACFFSMETNSPPEILFPWHDRWHELWAVGNLALPHLRYYIYISLLCINIINLYRILRHRCIYAYTHDTLEHLNSGHSVGPALTRAAWAVWPSHDWGALGTGLMDGYNHGNDPICWDTSPRNIYRYIYICTYIYIYICVCVCV